jgi:hypothetical protein
VQNIVSKAEFARTVGVDKARVTQWIAAGQLSGDALVMVGRSERIDADIARRQLGRRVDVDQRLGARHGDAGGPLEALQRERLVALELANDEAREAALARSGRYVEADAMRLELGRALGRLVALYDGELAGIAEAIAARSNLPARDALHLLRTTFRDARARLSDISAEEAVREPETLEAVP